MVGHQDPYLCLHPMFVPAERGKLPGSPSALRRPAGRRDRRWVPAWRPHVGEGLDDRLLAVTLDDLAAVVAGAPQERVHPAVATPRCSAYKLPPVLGTQAQARTDSIRPTFLRSETVLNCYFGVLFGTSWSITSREKFFDFRNKAIFSVEFICYVCANLCNKTAFNFKTITVMVSEGFSRWG